MIQNGFVNTLRSVIVALWEKNRMLHILYKNGVSRINVLKIITDLTESEIFNDIEEEEDDWSSIEEEANILFSNMDETKKIEEIKRIKNEKEKEEVEEVQISQYRSEQEERIRAKQQELIDKGVVKPNLFTAQKSIKVTTRYGRTPLHEAIAMRDINLVKKYLKSDKYLKETDNNGHTPIEMAFYEEYEEALALFKIYYKDRK